MGLTCIKFAAILPAMKTAQDIIDYIGAETAMKALGVKPSAVRMAVKKNKLAASWYDALERLCGRPLDRALFTFKGQEQ